MYMLTIMMSTRKTMSVQVLLHNAYTFLSPLLQHPAIQSTIIHLATPFTYHHPGSSQNLAVRHLSLTTIALSAVPTTCDLLCPRQAFLFTLFNFPCSAWNFLFTFFVPHTPPTRTSLKTSALWYPPTHHHRLSRLIPHFTNFAS